MVLGTECNGARDRVQCSGCLGQYSGLNAVVLGIECNGASVLEMERRVLGVLRKMFYTGRNGARDRVQQCSGA